MSDWVRWPESRIVPVRSGLLANVNTMKKPLLCLVFAVLWVVSPTGLTTVFGQPNCSILVNAGDDAILCQSGETTTLSAQISDEYLDLAWEPSAGLGDPTAASTSALVNNTTTYSVTVRSLSPINLIFNGDFTQGNTGFTSDYAYGTGGSLGPLTEEGHYVIDNNARNTHRRFAPCTDRSGGGNMMVVNASGQQDNFWCQQVEVNEGASYDFSAWVTSVNAENPARLQFSIGGDLLGTEFAVSDDLCDWQEFSAQWTAPATAQVEICVVNVNLTPAGNDFAMDELTFREICVTTDSITLTVAELNTDWSVPGSICQNDAAVMLDDWLQPTATTGGTWMLDGTELVTLDPSGLAAGQYTLQYAVQEDICEESNETFIEILAAPNAGQAAEAPRFCGGDMQTVVLTDLLTGADPGGIWMDVSGANAAGAAFNAAAGTLDVSALAGGTYAFAYTVGEGGQCGTEQTTVSVVIDPLPVVDLGEDRVLDCTFPAIGLGAGVAQSDAYTYQWSDATGATISTERELTVDQEGVYTLLVVDTQSGCSSEDELTVVSNIEEISAQISTIPASCFNTQDGILRIEQVSGGTSPYMYSLDGNPFLSQTEYGNLLAGNHTIEIMDAGGCTTVYDAAIDAPSELQVSIIADASEVSIGQSVGLEVLINSDDNRASEIIWSPAPADCDNCQRIEVSPTRTTLYSVRVTDENGCIADAEISILVSRDIDIYVPNAFSPNQDGINDLFMVYAGAGITIRNLNIADRWGNLYFQENDFSPNDPGRAWDGTFQGKKVPIGVYAYSLEIELPSGELFIQVGEVSVIY